MENLIVLTKDKHVCLTIAICDGFLQTHSHINNTVNVQVKTSIRLHAVLTSNFKLATSMHCDFCCKRSIKYITVSFYSNQ